jgi:hypothetical protein
MDEEEGDTVVTSNRQKCINRSIISAHYFHVTKICRFSLVGEKFDEGLMVEMVGE